MCCPAVPQVTQYWQSVQKMQEQSALFTKSFTDTIDIVQRDSKNQTDTYPGLANVVLSLQYSTKAVKLNRKYIISDLVALFQFTNCLVFNKKCIANDY